VGSTEAVNDPASVPPALDQSSEAEFGEMLTGECGTATCDHSQRGYVSVVVSKRPQQPYPSGIGQQGEGHDRGRHLVVFKNVGVLGLGR
jgi:hypothetical protein